jgi:hypothetical protein
MYAGVTLQGTAMDMATAVHSVLRITEIKRVGVPMSRMESEVKQIIV